MLSDNFEDYTETLSGDFPLTRSYEIVKNWLIDMDIVALDNQFPFDVITYSKSNFTMCDDHFDIGLRETRTNEFVNPIRYKQRTGRYDVWGLREEGEHREIITQILLDMDNIGEMHTRLAKSVLLEISVVGGFASVLMMISRQSYAVLGQPFRDLKLAVNYSKLHKKVKTNSKHDFYSKTADFESQMGCCFYVKFFIYKFLPCLCIRKKPPKADSILLIEDEKSSPNFFDLIDHFEQLF